jgi:hypothetical protein
MTEVMGFPRPALQRTALGTYVCDRRRWECHAPVSPIVALFQRRFGRSVLFCVGIFARTVSKICVSKLMTAIHPATKDRGVSRLNLYKQTVVHYTYWGVSLHNLRTDNNEYIRNWRG